MQHRSGGSGNIFLAPTAPEPVYRGVAAVAGANDDDGGIVAVATDGRTKPV